MVKFSKIREDAVIPSIGVDGCAGVYLHSVHDIVLRERVVTAVHTGLEVSMPEGVTGLVWPTNGMAITYAVDTVARLVGEGELKVYLINHGFCPVTIKKGDRVAKVVFNRVEVGFTAGKVGGPLGSPPYYYSTVSIGGIDG